MPSRRLLAFVAPLVLVLLGPGPGAVSGHAVPGTTSEAGSRAGAELVRLAAERERTLAEQARVVGAEAARLDAAAERERRERAEVREDAARAAGHDVGVTDPRTMARQMADRRWGWSGAEWTCIDQLITSESSWDPRAVNPSSGAYGLVQSLPAEKMASVGDDWRTNPATQLEWGFDYVRDVYGTPCQAWSFHQANNWY